MYRSAIEYLRSWQVKPNRKPLIVRGARQVGKSHLVRMFAQECFDTLIELDFEQSPLLSSLFESNDPSRIIRSLEVECETDIVPGRTLLFLDEIQASPRVIASLRYFFEKMPSLHVIAAGSLLEFALDEPSHSVPVGRVEYMFLGPMTFGEFLKASGFGKLLAFVDNYRLGDAVPEAIHERLMEQVRIYAVVGGMPGSVRAFVDSSLRACEEEKHAIINTYYDDFGKYRGRVDAGRIRRVFDSIPRLVGGKLKYVNIDADDQARNLGRALDLLCSARVVYRVCHSSANGVPLRAEVNESVVKPLFLDVGLMASGCGLNLLDMERPADLIMVNQGAVCEQIVGQHLLYAGPPFVRPELFYWVREKKTSNAEVDYLLSSGSTIVPVEVKAGKTGTLKSMQVFLDSKHKDLAVRINSAPPAYHESYYSLPGKTGRTFRLLSIPFYLIGEVQRLVTAAT